MCITSLAISTSSFKASGVSAPVGSSSAAAQSKNASHLLLGNDIFAGSTPAAMCGFWRLSMTG